MNAPTPEEGLRNILDAQKTRLPELIDWFLHKRKSVRLGSVLMSIASRSKTRGMADYFLEQNLSGLKQNFYVASRLTLAAINLDGGPDFEVGNEIFYALLSDNMDVINAMARVETPNLLSDRDNPLRSRFKVHMWQLAILGDYDELQLKVEKLAKNGRKEDRVLASTGKDFFMLLMQSDKQGLEELIQKHALTRSADPLTEDFLSFLGVLEAKLCWLKGIPVQIDSSMVPMALLPVSPLSHYDDVYEFLRPGWIPPPQGLVGKVSRWLKK